MDFSPDFNTYKKLGVVTSLIARDFYTLDPPHRIPTVSEYCESFQVSRGVIQDALATLEHSGSITLEKQGRKGTFLISKKPKELYPFTNWEIITGTMPPPITVPFQGLATAVCSIMTDHETPFSFAFISGAHRRIYMLNCGLYDFTIVSAYSGYHYIKEYPNLRMISNLYPAVYSLMPYVVAVNRAGVTSVLDGMRVLVDLSCYDQSNLTSALCEGKKVITVEGSSVGIREVFTSGEVDAVVCRYDTWLDEMSGVSILPIKGQESTTIPVLLTNVKNYGIDRLLSRLTDSAKICDVQQTVIQNPGKVRFY